MTDTYEVLGNPYVDPSELLIGRNQVPGAPRLIVGCHPSREAMVHDVLRRAKEAEADLDDAFDRIRALLSREGEPTK